MVLNLITNLDFFKFKGGNQYAAHIIGLALDQVETIAYTEKKMTIAFSVPTVFCGDC